MSKPLVIAHRGACGYRPENTLESFELGIQQGADGIEFDLVNTSDQQLIIRHENTLGETTDIASKSEFREFKRAGLVEGIEVSDWFTEDLDLGQIKTLRAVERLGELRPGSAKFNGQFQIPTFNEILNASFIEGKIIVCEIKQGTHINVLSNQIGKLVADEIFKSPVQQRNVKLVIESFSFELLLEAKDELQKLKVPAKYFFAVDEAEPDPAWLEELSTQVDGLSISTHLLFSESNWVEAAHSVGLAIWVFTARAERAETSIDEYYEQFIASGVDGIFADQPDLLRRVLADRG